MNNFIFENPTKIIFGSDTQLQVGTLVSGYSNKVLLHYGGGSIKKSGLYDQVRESLEREGIYCLELGGVRPNPRLSLVRDGIAICKKEGISFILAVGGGSVIDSAKAISLGAANDCDVWDFYIGKAEAKAVIPVGVILTIPAAGSESSSGSVITNEEGQYKRSYDCPLMYPRFAILNPKLSYTLSPHQAACGIADIMAHIMERYFTQTEHTDLSDRLCEAAMKTVVNHADRVISDGSNYDAWAEIMWSGTLAHNNLLGKGREEDWASHQIEHELSGMYDITHGAGLAIIFPAWMRYVCHRNQKRFVQFAIRVWSVDFSMMQEEVIVQEGIERLVKFFQGLGLSTTLRELGIGDEKFQEMAEKTVDRGPVGNFVKLDKEDVVQILNIAK